jgi:hypothetical protein
MWPVTIYKRIPSIPSPSEREAQLTGAECTGKLRRAEARKDVCAVLSRVEAVLVQSVAGEEVRRGRVGRESVGAQHVGTGIGFGGKKGRSMRGSSRRLACYFRFNHEGSVFVFGGTWRQYLLGIVQPHRVVASDCLACAICSYMHNLAVRAGQILATAWQTDVLLDDSMYAAMVDVRVPTRNYTLAASM